MGKPLPRRGKGKRGGPPSPFQKSHRTWRKPQRVFTERGEKRSRKPWEKAIHNHGDFSAVSWGKPAILGSVRRQFPDLCFLKAGA